MRKRQFILFALFSLLLVVACSEDDTNPVNGGPSSDSLAPATIADLSAENPTANTVTLYFTAPGDDNNIGRAHQYDVRYAASIITELNFSSATKFTFTELPNVGTVEDTIIVTGLLPATQYYFAIKTADEVPNWSGISNIDSATTLLTGSWTVYNTANSHIPNDTIYDIAFDQALKYFGTPSGLVKFDNSNWQLFDASYHITVDTIVDTMTSDTIYDTIRTIPSDLITSVAANDNNEVWMGSGSKGLSRLVDTTAVLFDIDNSGLISNAIADLLAETNSLWVATTNLGLSHFDGDTTWTNYTVSNSDLAYNFINAIEKTASGNLWIAYNFGGASLYDGIDFTLYNSSNGLATSGVWDMFALGNDSMLFATENGLFIFDGGTGWVNYPAVDSGLVDDDVTSVTRDNNGVIWAGTRIGLCRYDGTDWTTYTTANSGLPDDYIHVLKVDMFGNLWVGTNYGVAVLEAN